MEKFIFRTRLVITCAHCIAPRGLINMPLPGRLSSVRAVQQWSTARNKRLECTENPNPEYQTIKVQWEAQPAAHGSRLLQPRSMTMQDQLNANPKPCKRVPWNKGK